jgi:hypothetical protein
MVYQRRIYRGCSEWCAPFLVTCSNPQWLQAIIPWGNLRYYYILILDLVGNYIQTIYYHASTSENIHAPIQRVTIWHIMNRCSTQNAENGMHAGLQIWKKFCRSSQYHPGTYKVLLNVSSSLYNIYVPRKQLRILQSKEITGWACIYL